MCFTYCFTHSSCHRAKCSKLVSVNVSNVNILNRPKGTIIFNHIKSKLPFALMYKITVTLSHMCAWVQEHFIPIMTKMIRLNLWGQLVGLFMNVTATWHRNTSKDRALGDDREPRKASPAPKHVFHWVWCWQSRDSWLAKRRHSFSLGTEAMGSSSPAVRWRPWTP